MKTKARLKCTHCSTTCTYTLYIYQSETACKKCKNEQDIKFTDSKMTKGLLY